MTTKQHSTAEAKRAACLKILADGSATLSEAARLARTSRQLVRYWSDTAGVNWKRARRERLAKEWRKQIASAKS